MMKKRYPILVLLAIVIILLLSAFTGNGISSVAGYYPEPFLLSPDFGEVVPCDKPILFRWKPPDVNKYEPDEYEYELFREGESVNQVIKVLLDSTKYKYDGPIKCGQRYTWSVDVHRPSGLQKSVNWHFFTEEATPVSSNQDKSPFIFPVWLYYLIAAILFIVLILGILKFTRN
jgi:hypothetical protein